MPGLYLHIPFCKQACYYCDFHFSTDRRFVGDLVEAMGKELELQKGFIAGELETIYFGGGTPSLIPTDLLQSLLLQIRHCFNVSRDAEITLEANPDDLDPQKLDVLRRIGINRLSIGVQSFDNELLHYLNRAHNTEQARRCLHESRTAGFNNVSLDLIYAIPGLSAEKWRETLMEAVSFKPEHMSLYSLTIEEKTVFGNWKKKGELHQVDEEESAGQFEIAKEMLEAQGYEHYEISNFARHGFRARHNSNYWLQVPYLGVGPGAHSYDGGQRLINVRNNSSYIKALLNGILPSEVERLTPENKINEYILTRLRTSWGCDLQHLRNELNDDLTARCPEVLNHYQEAGMILVSDNILRLTPKGMLFADQIAGELMKA